MFVVLVGYLEHEDQQRMHKNTMDEWFNDVEGDTGFLPPKLLRTQKSCLCHTTLQILGYSVSVASTVVNYIMSVINSATLLACEDGFFVKSVDIVAECAMPCLGHPKSK